MRRYDIVVPSKYTKNGEEKTAWKNVGTLIRFPETESKEEGYIIELNMFPNTSFKVFEQKQKDNKPKTIEPETPEELPEESDEIPF